MNSTPSPAPVPDPIDPDTALEAQRLEHMIQAGMELIDMVLLEARTATQVAATDPAKRPKTGDHVLAFSRITISVRQAMADARKLKQGAATAKQPASTSPQPTEEAARRALERKLKREARSYIDLQIFADYEGEEMEKMYSKLSERLDDPTFMIEFGEASIGTVVATVSDQIGVKFNGKYFTDEQLDARWPEEMPGGIRKVPRKKVYPRDYGYREEATAAYIAQGKPLPVIPPRKPPE